MAGLVAVQRRLAGIPALAMLLLRAPFPLTWLLFALVGLALCGCSPGSESDGDKDRWSETAGRIMRTYESRLFEISPVKVGHYGVRMYRLTGQRKYLNAALTDLYVFGERLVYYSCNLDRPGFVRERAKHEIGRLGAGTRAKARREAAAGRPEFFYFTALLMRSMIHTSQLGIEGPCDEKALTALKVADLRAGFTDPAMMRSWGAQLVNYAFWAEQLGVGSYVDEVEQNYRRVFPDSDDHELDAAQFRNKLYVLTHFVIQASEYYQHGVSRQELDWVLRYFERNIDRILAQATADLLSEVGICFLLAGAHDHPIVRRLRNAIEEKYVPGYGLIPSPSGDPDLALGEHRNVLAIIFLDWRGGWHKGPLLRDFEEVRGRLPRSIGDRSRLVVGP